MHVFLVFFSKKLPSIGFSWNISDVGYKSQIMFRKEVQRDEDIESNYISSNVLGRMIEFVA